MSATLRDSEERNGLASLLIGTVRPSTSSMSSAFKKAYWSAAIAIGFYAAIVGVLTVPWVQRQ